MFTLTWSVLLSEVRNSEYLQKKKKKSSMNFVQTCWVWGILSTEGRVEVECMDVEMRNLDWNEENIEKGVYTQRPTCEMKGSHFLNEFA